MSGKYGMGIKHKNTGHAKQLLGFHGALYYTMCKLDPNKREIKEEVKQVGPNPARGNPPVVLSDETVASMRWDHEKNRLSYNHLASKYGVTRGRVIQLVTYVNRGHIKAAPPQPPEQQ